MNIILHKNKLLFTATIGGIAKGRYISMIDSDDWISLEMYEKLYNFAEKYAYDIVVCDYFWDELMVVKYGEIYLYYSQ